MLNDLRSMSLIWDIEPDVADRLTRCYASGCFIIYDLENISDENDIDAFLLVSDMIACICETQPESYLMYANIDAAIDDFIDAAQGLAILDVPERYKVFELLVNYILDVEFGAEITNHSCFDPKKIRYFRNLIQFFAGWLEISGKQLTDITNEQFAYSKNQWKLLKEKSKEDRIDNFYK